MLFVLRGEVGHLDARFLHQFDAIVESVFLGIDHPLDSCLDDELGAFYAGEAVT